MGVYINTSHLVALSSEHKHEIGEDLGLNGMSHTKSVPQQILNILLRGKINRISDNLLPKKVELEPAKSFFADIPEHTIQKQFGKINFLIHRTYLLANNLYRGTIEDLLGQLVEKGILANLHILSQVLMRCNSLVECSSVLEHEQFRHLKGTYDEYIIEIVYKRCKNPTQIRWAEGFFVRWGKSINKRHMPKQLSDVLTPVTSEDSPRQQTVVPVAPVAISLSDQDAIAFGRKRRQFVQKDTAYTGRSRDMPKPRKPGTDVPKKKIKTKGGVPPKKPTKK